MPLCRPSVRDQVTDLAGGFRRVVPGGRLLLAEVKSHSWVTRNGTAPLPAEDENCQLVTVTEEEIKNSVRVIPRLGTF